MSEITRDQIVAAARRAAAESGKSPSRADFQRLTGISQYHIYRLFPEGGWSEVKQLAGLMPHPKHREPLNDDDLLRHFHEVAVRLSDIPTWSTFNHHSDISADVVRRRFGGMQGTLKRYHAWLEVNDPDSPQLAALEVRSRHEIPSPPQLPAIPDQSSQPPSQRSIEWEKLDGPNFGPPLDFRGLRHAPINEQGVVFLFGMVAYELGFIVEAVNAAFPDCEAKRRVDARRDRWQRVRIEFEYRSRNFRDHGHDPSGCDLVVCWEHDWPDCPLQVLELRTVIDRLDS